MRSVYKSENFVRKLDSPMLLGKFNLLLHPCCIFSVRRELSMLYKNDFLFTVEVTVTIFLSFFFYLMILYQISFIAFILNQVKKTRMQKICFIFTLSIKFNSIINRISVWLKKFFLILIKEDQFFFLTIHPQKRTCLRHLQVACVNIGV